MLLMVISPGGRTRVNCSLCCTSGIWRPMVAGMLWCRKAMDGNGSEEWYDLRPFMFRAPLLVQV